MEHNGLGSYRVRGTGTRGSRREMFSTKAVVFVRPPYTYTYTHIYTYTYTYTHTHIHIHTLQDTCKVIMIPTGFDERLRNAIDWHEGERA